MTKIKAILVDDHPVFREGIKFLISGKNFAEVVAEASNGREFLEILPKHSPDIVLMDIDMPEMNGIDATKKAIEKNPALNILALTMFGDEIYYQRMIQAGVKGFLLKTSKLPELEEAVNAVSKGENYFSNEILKKIIVKFNKPENNIELTERETEVLQYICKGFTNEEIAQKVNLSVAGVKYNRNNLYSKTNCNNSASLIVYAIKNKLITV
jgi:DNA-binding NarL/FixJ family response regulator